MLTKVSVELYGYMKEWIKRVEQFTKSLYPFRTENKPWPDPVPLLWPLDAVEEGGYGFDPSRPSFLLAVITFGISDVQKNSCERSEDLNGFNAKTKELKYIRMKGGYHSKPD